MYSAQEFDHVFTSHGSDKEAHGYGIVYENAFQDFGILSQFKIFAKKSILANVSSIESSMK